VTRVKIISTNDWHPAAKLVLRCRTQR
jgi:hypothetical protein